MEGCIAPSEVPGVLTDESSVFGNIAERLIEMDFVKNHLGSYFNVYVDDNNLSSYMFFLKSHNPHLDLYNFAGTLISTELGLVRPDILIHTSSERVFYEIKPNSSSGLRAGITKVGTLSATYINFLLPYTPGFFYTPCQIVVASVVGQLTVRLKTELKGPGLIVYQLCLESTALLELATLAAILRYVIKKMNEQAKSDTFRPIDLSPAFAREGEFAKLATTLGLVIAAGAVAVGWKFFWRAVAARFAVRGATAALLAAADGPLPIGDLIAAGMAIWTVVDIIRLYDVLWAEAAKLPQEA